MYSECAQQKRAKHHCHSSCTTNPSYLKYLVVVDVLRVIPGVPVHLRHRHLFEEGCIHGAERTFSTRAENTCLAKYIDTTAVRTELNQENIINRTKPWRRNCRACTRASSPDYLPSLLDQHPHNSTKSNHLRHQRQQQRHRVSMPLAHTLPGKRLSTSWHATAPEQVSSTWRGDREEGASQPRTQQ